MRDGCHIFGNGKSSKTTNKSQHHKFPSGLGYPKPEGRTKENLTHFFGHYLREKSSPITGLSILLVRNGVLSGIVCRVFHKVKDRVRWSIGRNPRIHAIWMPQCGWEKGKMCFIKRKDKTFVSNHRDLPKKIVVIFRENRSKNQNKWTFSRMSSTFICKFSLF